MKKKQIEKIFAQELDIIKDQHKIDLCLSVLESLDDSWWITPTSSTGKYHHEVCNRRYGIIIHVKLVCQYAMILSEAFYGRKSLDHLPNIMMACLLHDIGKKAKYSNYSEYENHPLEAIKLINQQTNKEFTLLNDKEIYDMIKFHMGIFGKNEMKKPIEDFSMNELIVYLSDFLASRKIQNHETWIKHNYNRIKEIIES